MTTRFDTYVSTSTMGLDAEIRQVCTYIPDNVKIAAYYGVSAERVARIRAGRRPQKTAYAGDPNGKGGPPIEAKPFHFANLEEANAKHVAALHRFYKNREQQKIGDSPSPNRPYNSAAI